MTRLVGELQAEGLRTKYAGGPISKQAIHRILTNRVYLGDAMHKGVAYRGEHKAIVPKALWDKVQALIDVSPRSRAQAARATEPALLKGLIFGPDGRPMIPSFTRKDQKAYRYYVGLAALKHADDNLALRRVPAGEVERAVMGQVRVLLRAPELVVRTARAAKGRGVDVTVDEVRNALADLDPLWNELFPAEQSRIVRLLVERVDVAPNGLTLRLWTEGLTTMVDELRGARPNVRAA